jgi:hypothetical protein
MSPPTGYVIGIDPGLKGGVTLYAWTKTATHISSFIMPIRKARYTRNKQLVDLVALKQKLANFAVPVASCNLVCLERVVARPMEGVTSSLTSGTLLGQLLAFFELEVLDPELPMSRHWKDAVLPETTKDKQAAVDLCRREFPELNLLPSTRHRKPHDGMADSVCIAVYARQLVEKRHGQPGCPDRVAPGRSSSSRRRGSRRRRGPAPGSVQRTADGQPDHPG